MELNGRVALVTGVSKGIGLATVHALLDEGAIVIGWGRTDPAINHPDYHFKPTDVRSEESVAQSWAWLENKFPDGVDILINNAGLGYFYSFEETPTDALKEMFETNVFGIYYVTRLAIPGMREKQSGHIINIASIAATNGIENMSGYCGTKFAVRGITMSLMKELRNDGIKVTAINPGSVKTNFFDKIDVVTVNDNMMMPEDIASTIIHVLKSPPNYLQVEIEVRPLQPKGKKK